MFDRVVERVFLFKKTVRETDENKIRDFLCHNHVFFLLDGSLYKIPFLVESHMYQFVCRYHFMLGSEVMASKSPCTENTFMDMPVNFSTGSRLYFLYLFRTITL